MQERSEFQRTNMLIALGGGRTNKQKGKDLSEKARKMYAEERQRVDNVENRAIHAAVARSPHIAAADPQGNVTGVDHVGSSIASLASSVKEAPRFGLNAKALIMQAAAEAAHSASFVPIKQPTKGPSAASTHDDALCLTISDPSGRAWGEAHLPSNLLSIALYNCL